LARELEGKPFHLIATHCQNQPKESVVAYVKKQKLAATTPNLTVSSFGGHPKVKGNGYVPYYMIFDQHGDLSYHHMCGGYHGGDGLEMIDRVNALLKETPAIYLGREPFNAVPKLAARVAQKKKLAAAVKEIEKRLAEARGDEKAELERLQEAATRYRERELANAERLLATQPAKVVSAMTALSKDFQGTALAVDEKLAEYKKSDVLEQSIAVAKSFAKLVKRVEKLDPGKRRDKELAKLDKLVAENETLPIAATIKEYAAGLK